MPVDRQKRKRPVASCTECYSKKQKCNHQYPCNHCTRRRRPDLCNYVPLEAQTEDEDTNTLSTQPTPALRVALREALISPDAVSCEIGTRVAPLSRQNSVNGAPLPQLDSTGRIFEANLQSCFGYFDESCSNLFGLMIKFNILDKEELEGATHLPVLEKVFPEISAHFHQLPKRAILDCLVQNFFKEVNWIHEIIYSTSFLTQYEAWWEMLSSARMEDLEFGVLLLRICAYSAQFLPSRGYTADTICGVSISMIREHCHNLSDSLTRLCESVGGMRSFTSIQALCFAASYLENEGRMKEAWYLMGNVIKTALDIGIHREVTASLSPQLSNLEKDMRRRVFWNLYIWDRTWSIVLDRSPHMHDDQCRVSYPKMSLGPKRANSNEPDTFLERSLQARLAKIWNSIPRSAVNRPLAYDPAAVEEHLDRLCREFIFNLPAVFDIHNPNKEWDLHRPILVRQRQMLRISVFTLLCQIYRPVLLLSSAQIDSMAYYKRCLIARHRTTLANAAISLLDSIAQLHSDMGGNQTKYFLISFYTFEPAMLLIMYLLSSEKISKTLSQGQTMYESHPVLGALNVLEDKAFSNPNAPSHSQCLAEIYRARLRLNTLREVSPIAELGGHKIHQMVDRLVLLNAKIDPEQGEPQRSTRSDTDLNAQSKIGMDSEQQQQPVGGVGASTIYANDALPNFLQDDWVDDDLGPTWNESAASATQQLFTESNLDCLFSESLHWPTTEPFGGPGPPASEGITSTDTSKLKYPTTAPTTTALPATNATRSSIPLFTIPSPFLGTVSEMSQSSISTTSTRVNYDYPGNAEGLHTNPENDLDLI